MSRTKETFIRLALSYNVLQWGEFKLKSGRISPYFFNAGLFYQNHALHELGHYYAELIIKQQLPIEHLFGPAYKGLPLATATAIALDDYNKSVTVTFNRKEAKDHGEGGQLIGAPLSGHTAMIDDVITAGTAFRESQQLIQAHGGKLTAVFIALDRCERGLNERSAIADIQAQGIAVHAIITLFDLIEYLENENELALVKKLQSYHEQYGA